jgi:hypothetical protein
MSLDRRSLLKLLPIAGFPLQSPAEDAIPAEVAAVSLPEKTRVIAVLSLKKPTTQQVDREVFDRLRAILDASGMEDVRAIVVPAFSELDFYAIPPQGEQSCSVSEPSKSESSASSR